MRNKSPSIVRSHRTKTTVEVTCRACEVKVAYHRQYLDREYDLIGCPRCSALIGVRFVDVSDA